MFLDSFQKTPFRKLASDPSKTRQNSQSLLECPTFCSCGWVKMPSSRTFCSSGSNRQLSGEALGWISRRLSEGIQAVVSNLLETLQDNQKKTWMSMISRGLGSRNFVQKSFGLVFRSLVPASFPRNCSCPPLLQQILIVVILFPFLPHYAIPLP